MATTIPSLCKVDAGLQNYENLAKTGSVVDLYFNEKSKSSYSRSALSDYSNTLQLAGGEYICYQLSAEYSVLSLYSLGDASAGRTLKAHLPQQLFHMHHTFTIRENGNLLVIEMILSDGLYLIVSLPVNCLLDRITDIPENWFVAVNPYDFTVRKPQYVHSVSEDLTVVFLEDGGLLGLRRRLNEKGQLDMAPILFNDNSYLLGLSRLFFSKEKTSQDSNVVSCLLYRERFLITLTQGCRLKIWDLERQAVIFEKHLASEQKNVNRMYETLGQFLSLFEDKLAIFLPFENGLFQLWDLRLDSNGGLLLSPGSIYPCNLTSSAIWSLVDMKLTKPLEGLGQNGFVNIVVLWKSNRIMKLQVLNILENNLPMHQWLDATNQSIGDLRTDLSFESDFNAADRLLILKSSYNSELLKQAEKVLGENQVLISPNQSENDEYFLNLESVLKDLKKQNDEPSSLTLYQNGIILVNSLSLYSHALYRVTTSLESSYYSLRKEENSGDALNRFLGTVEGFAATLPTHVLTNISSALVEAVTSHFPHQIPLKEVFSSLFSQHLAGSFHIANLKKLFEDLNQFDVTVVLQSFFDNMLQRSELDHALVDSVYPNSLMNVAILESTHQAVLIQNSFICKIALIFAFMEFENTTLQLRFQEQLETLLEFHYKQQLWIQLYRLDKNLLASEMLARTSKFGKGHRISSYAEWSSAQAVILKELYSMAVSPNPLFIESFDAFIVSGTRSSQMSILFLTTIQKSFYIHSNVAHEFMLGLAFFVCGVYDQAFEFLKKHPYPDALPKEMPDRLFMPLQKDGHLWRDVVGSFKLPNKHAAYYFHLSKLFSIAKSYDYALRCAKKSIKLSAENTNEEDTQDVKSAQLLQYLDILIVFCDYEEILDVLRCSPDINPESVKASYYGRLVSSHMHKEAFLSTLLNLCAKSEGLYLTTQDYNLIDKILRQDIATGSWIAFKRVYAFRLVNGQARSAAEALYDYVIVGDDKDIKKRCLLLIVNIMNTFSAKKDRWFIAGGQLITIDYLRQGLDKLDNHKTNVSAH
ncbi:LAFA_0C07228g1_1 [Lachancea sp. 'fantastica']|nr:LAFA_0C07228g1_1 [Lachancea sp. 'fantastica']